MPRIRWLHLMHQLPAKPAYFRVRIWRRLQAVGAVALRGRAELAVNEWKARLTGNTEMADPVSDRKTEFRGRTQVTREGACIDRIACGCRCQSGRVVCSPCAVPAAGAGGNTRHAFRGTDCEPRRSVGRTLGVHSAFSLEDRRHRDARNLLRREPSSVLTSRCAN